LYRLGRERYRDLVLLLAADGRLDRETLAELLNGAAQWEIPQFPIAGRDVTAAGIPPGPRIGRLLAALRCWWEESDFRPDRAACLARLAELIAQEQRTAGNDGAIDDPDNGF
jgi:poly(A) polymerase